MRRIAWAAVTLGLAALAGAVPSSLAQGGSTASPLARVEPAAFGVRFPAGTFGNLNASAAGPAKIDLGQVLGKKPVVLYYWIPRNKRSEEMFLALQAIAKRVGDSKLALYGVCATGPDMGPDLVGARCKELGIQVPVLHDEGFRIGQELRVQRVPNVTVLDREGRLRLSHGASLEQTLEYKMSLEDGIERVARTGELGTYGYLPPYYPAVEMVGKKAPDFESATLSDGVNRRLASLLDPKALNVLVFWSVDCPHCRKSLPEVNDWLGKHPQGYNIISVANVKNDADKTRTSEFAKLHDFKFRTVVDPGLQIGEAYNVVSTPTVFILRPDGVVDAVLLNLEDDWSRTFEAKRRELVQ